jgi:hypothetical protein
MGQAKQRGSLQDRIKQSVQAKEEHLKNNPSTPRTKVPLKTAMLLGTLVVLGDQAFSNRNRF